MKAIIPPSPSVVKKMRQEIHRQCIAETEKYEIELDTAWVYAIRKVTKYGTKRMLRIYKAMFAAREEMKEWYQAETGDGIVETAMRFELRRDGIDVEKMYHDEKNNDRLQVKFVNRGKEK